MLANLGPGVLTRRIAILARHGQITIWSGTDGVALEALTVLVKMDGFKTCLHASSPLTSTVSNHQAFCSAAHPWNANFAPALVPEAKQAIRLSLEGVVTLLRRIMPSRSLRNPVSPAR